MKQIFFKKEYMDLILKGEKTSTIRLFTHLQENDKIYLVSGKNWLKALVTSVQKIPIESLTDEIAKTDGFQSKEELFKVLTKLYPNALLKEVFYINFVRVYEETA